METTWQVSAWIAERPIIEHYATDIECLAEAEAEETLMTDNTEQEYINILEAYHNGSLTDSESMSGIRELINKEYRLCQLSPKEYEAVKKFLLPLTIGLTTEIKIIIEDNLLEILGLHMLI